jgi:hypothetical protein
VNLRKRLSVAAETLIAMAMVAVLAAACAGGGGSSSLPVYMGSLGIGEVLQLSVDTASLTYSYTVLETSYAASGVRQGQTSTGTLTAAAHSSASTYPAGTYNVGPSSDGFITGGTVFPGLNGALVGDLSISLFPSIKIPVIAFANPKSSLVDFDGIYNYQGFTCSAPGIADVAGASGCLSNYGTISIAATANSSLASYTECKGGDITAQTAHPCTGAPLTGYLAAMPSGSSGVYDFQDSAGNHLGWLFAFSAANGQKIAVIDHDDAISTPNEFGYTLLAGYASLTQGVPNGSYYAKTNEQGESLVTVATSGVNTTTTTATTAYYSTVQSGVAGTLTLNSPWNGFSTYNIPASGVSPAVSGIALANGSGAYANSSATDSALFAVGVAYTPKCSGSLSVCSHF